MSTDKQNLSSLVWAIAEILRGDFKQSEYGKVILPFVVLRRLDCILESTKDEVLNVASTLHDDMYDDARNQILYVAAGDNVKVYNLSPFTFEKLKGQDPRQLHDNLVDYITKFSGNVRDILLEKFLFTDQLKRLNEGGILWSVFERFCSIDLHPDTVSNIDMGYLFEDLIRRFSEISNETAGEHFTPREVIQLIVDLLIANDDERLTKRGIIRQVYDPACGTGGMLALTEEALKEFNDGIRVELFGQELNAESFGICKSDMLVTGHDPEQIAFGNTLVSDAHADKRFHYMLSNPPYGVDWKKYQEPIKTEAKTMGFDGRFGAGTPRISDGQLLFLQHMISKMRDDENGSRIGIVMNGSPLFTGGAGSGESEIRRWMLENDWVESIIALPTDLFYNTGIQTYVWILANRKPENRQGKVQLIDASSERFWKPMRKSLGSKRREIPDEARAQIVRIYAGFMEAQGEEDDASRIFETVDFGYREIRVERPLRLNFRVDSERLERLAEQRIFAKLEEDRQTGIRSALEKIGDGLFLNRDEFDKLLTDNLRNAEITVSAPLKKAILSSLSEKDDEADICTGKDGSPEPDPDLRDHELVPLSENYQDYMEREVLPFVPDAWVDEKYTDPRNKQVGRVGYEINFNRYFYKPVPMRSLEEIQTDILALQCEIDSLLPNFILRTPKVEYDVMKPRIYVDTSVIRGCEDVKFRKYSRLLFKAFQQEKAIMVISDVTREELLGDPENVAKIPDQVPKTQTELLKETEQARDLANAYISSGAIGSAHYNDALHVAIASLGKVDVVVSWNFKHIVNWGRIQAYNSVNRKLGYPEIDIRPPENIYHED
ncbi:MAG: N-6 DNA methylase [Gammaproteobacteria bacterium]|nr:N-6 DNA methylase [Gammaproteobacteria bacterium]